MAYQEDIDAETYLKEWVVSTQNIVGSVMVKNKVKFSDTDLANINITLIKTGEEMWQMTFRSRASLQFVNMGSGRGAGKEQRKANSRNPSASSRKPKKILMKPLFSRLNSLQSVLVTSVAEMAQFNIEKFKDLIQASNVG
jgi:hypothetical protein